MCRRRSGARRGGQLTGYPRVPTTRGMAMRTLENFIDGAFRPALDGSTEAALNPATGEEIAQAPLSGAADIDAAVAAARRAFESWSQTTPAARAEALLALAAAIEEHGEELAREEAINAGKPL